MLAQKLICFTRPVVWWCLLEKETYEMLITFKIERGGLKRQKLKRQNKNKLLTKTSLRLFYSIEGEMFLLYFSKIEDIKKYLSRGITVLKIL